MRLLIIGLLLLTITGCGNVKEEEMIEHLVSSHSDFYMLYAIPGKDKENSDSREIQDYYSVNFNQFLSKESLDTLLYGTYIWLVPGEYPGIESFEYVEKLEFNEFPSFVIFDSETLVFKSSNIEEVDEFLSAREETPGIKLRKEQEIDYHTGE
ncbi:MULTISPECIES: hypothetical protein [Sutcliffiella]|uniref:hypothetical protein n=1 Tax=Sutcliffiella TaxID=2837511 RepID=UPI0022DD7227|nr:MULTISPECIES: hypothetical protein [Sutcliffiella]MED4015214.1 hypothetical protein [Sutcliffiella cohnii]WBL13178.1 hypothetical protein O1A01_14690 [Sutcliffiella sp. NC1]